MRKILLSLLFFVIGIIPMTNVYASAKDDPDFVPIEELLARPVDDTTCATGVFARAIADNMGDVEDDAPEADVKAAIAEIMARKEVLEEVLACPEMSIYGDLDKIKFMPITYTFPTNGRVVTINYETQPKILKKHLLLANKHEVTTSDGPNPLIDPYGDVIWTNTDPAWYAIMVVQAGALKDFVGEGKNNTISLKYINDNIGKLYPNALLWGGMCTCRSALCNDNAYINVATRNTVGMAAQGQEDSNDYYVAGDVDLEWISYTEIALDVVISVVTFGGGAAALGALKAVRATRAMRGLVTTMRTLSKGEKVIEFIKMEQRVSKMEKELKAIKAAREVDKIKDNMRGLDAVRDADKIAKQEKEIKELEKVAGQVRNLDKTKDTEQLEKEIAEGQKTMNNLTRDNKDVRKFRESADSFNELQRYRNSLRGFRRGVPHHGNVFARSWKFLRAANSGASKIKQAEKLGRSSKFSGQIKDYLFQSTMRHSAKLAKAAEAGGFLYGAIKLAGDMYDYTSDSNSEFTNGIEFKPLLLLSADDIPGQENVVNYGMWLMWQGNSIDEADDDAAFLQAMDFANKFTLELRQYQEQENNYPCDVDVYVVRPIIREPDSDNPELYYLVMNDKPWSADRPASVANDAQYDTVSILRADLATAQQCRRDNVPYNDCLTRLQGNYR